MADTTEVKELTFEAIQAMSGEELLKAMHSRGAEVNAVIAAETKRVEDRMAADNEAFIKAEEDRAAEEARLEAEALEAAKSPEEKAAEEAEAAEAVAAAQKIADEAAAAEAARLEAEKKDLEEKERLAAEAAKPKEKIVRDYQATDDEGNPIGRRTHLEADNWEEMSQKLEEAHVNAVRYAERMKKRASLKPQFKQPETPINVLDEATLLEIQKDLESKDEIVSAKAKVKLELNEAAKERLQARYQTDFNNGRAVSLEFMRKHPEFNSCDANAKIIGDYVKANNLEWSVDNLEIAYAETESQLAPRQSVQPKEEPAVPVVKGEIKPEVVAANTAPASESVVAPVPAPVAAPVASAPVETVPAAPNVPAVTTKPPASGIEPGSLHGGRPELGTKKPVGYTKKQILDMPREEYKKRMKDPGFVRQVNILFKG